MKDVKKDDEHDEIAEAGFRPGIAAGKPSRSRKRGIRKMPLKNHAAVWNGIEKCLAEIEAGVHAHRKP